MIRHHGVGFQVVMAHLLAPLERRDDDSGDLRAVQVADAGLGGVESTVDPGENLPGGQRAWGWQEMQRHAAVQAPSDEQGFARGVEVGQAALGHARVVRRLAGNSLPK